MKEKRQKYFPVMFTETEWIDLETLQACYSAAGVHISKASLVRYSLKCLPRQSPFAAFP